MRTLPLLAVVVALAVACAHRRHDVPPMEGCAFDPPDGGACFCAMTVPGAPPTPMPAEPEYCQSREVPPGEDNSGDKWPWWTILFVPFFLRR